MKERRRGRRVALDILYEAEIRDVLPLESLEARRAGGWAVSAEGEEAGERDAAGLSSEAADYAMTLIGGVQEHQSEIDTLIAAYADRWALQRMPVIDRTLLRIALFEMLWEDDVPVAVAINEAVELAKELSTDDSGRFINGLLGGIAKQRELR